MTRKTLKKVKSQKKSKSQLRKTRKVRKHNEVGGGRGARAAARALGLSSAFGSPSGSVAAAAGRKYASKAAQGPARRLYTTPEDAARRAAANARARRALPLELTLF